MATALVVDDLESIRSDVSGFLTALGIEPIPAANGVQALERLEESPVDLVITDLVMPEMDGFELCEEIRRRPKLRSIPIIVTSSHRETHYIIQALRRGADDYISKPASQALLKRVIDRATSTV